MEDKYNSNMFLANMYVLTVVIFNVITAYFLMIGIRNNYITDAVYNLAKIMPISVFGSILIASSLVLFLAITFLTQFKEWLYIIGGLSSAFVHMTYITAIATYDMEGALMSRYLILTITCLIVVAVGVYDLYDKRRRK